MRRGRAPRILFAARKKSEMLMIDDTPAGAIITGPWAAPIIPEVSLPQFVMHGWAQLGNKPAVIDAASGRCMSYSELGAAIRREAARLTAIGMAQRDVLALCCPNSPEFVITSYGALAAGAVVSTMSTGWPCCCVRAARPGCRRA
jgi:non-ribosomal peptide synthetase component F